MASFKGFSGRAANRYFAKISETLDQSENCINQGIALAKTQPEPNRASAGGSSYVQIVMSRGMNTPPPVSEKNAYVLRDTIPAGSTVSRFERANEEILFNAFPQGVYVDDLKYAYIVDKQRRLDEEVHEHFQNTVNTLLHLCETDFCIPTATPKVARLLQLLQDELNQSPDLTQELTQTIQRFVATINEIDN